MGRLMRGDFEYHGSGSHDELHRLYGVDECPVCKSAEDHPAGKGVSEKERALLEAVKWSNRIEIARVAYAEALLRCHELGLSNIKIARKLGKSEAAVRMYLKRKKERQ